MDSSNWANWMTAGGAGMAGAGLGAMMGKYKNPADAGIGYMDQMPGEISKYLDPYINAGKNALPGLQDQYGKLMNDPGGRLNEIGTGLSSIPWISIRPPASLTRLRTRSRRRWHGRLASARTAKYGHCHRVSWTKITING